MRLNLLLLLTALMLCPAGVLAQRGDRKGHEMKEVWRKMDVPDAPPLSPEQALESFKVAPGFKVELFAAEPLVVDPVAMAWDGRGRLWVVEMRGYMPNVDGKGEDAANGRIVVLEDTDADGRADRSTVFLDKLVMPRAISIVHEQGKTTGVLVGEPPNLWYCVDNDGDLKIDDKQRVYDRYGRQGPVEHTDNGLLPALDNWLYNAKSDHRMRFADGQLTVEPSPFRGQWGITQDNFGRLYYNTNSSYLYVDPLQADYFERNEVAESRRFRSRRVVGNQGVYSIRVNPGINRGYKDKMLRDDGRLKRTTAVCGPAIYRGDQFPDDYVSDAFIPEPAGNVVSHFKITEKSIDLDGEQVIYDDPKWEQRAFLASTDERFRPVNAYTGPDGCLYIVDMYRGILQHKVYVTTFLRKQILERELDKPVGLGRIYRIVKTDRPVRNESINLVDLPTAKLVDKLKHDNGVIRDIAQRLLVQRGDQSAIAPLRKLATDADRAVTRIHALWTLSGIQAIDADTIADALRDEHEQVRIAALRTGEPLLTTGERDRFVALYRERADDDSERVRIQAVASAATHLTVEQLAVMIRPRINEGSVRDAALSGLALRENAMLEHVLVADAWRDEDSDIAAFVRELTTAVVRRRDAQDVTRLVEHAANDPRGQVRDAIIKGFEKSARKPKPIALTGQPDGAEKLAKKFEELNRYVRWSGDGAADIPQTAALTEQQQKLFDHGERLYGMTCFACHQPTGKGMAGLAPPLVGSDWVDGSPQRLARIVLHGVQGPIEVDGETWNLIMPGHGVNPMFDDRGTAAVLTYIRRAWNNEADPVSPELIKQVREATGDRLEPWTVDELMQVD